MREIVRVLFFQITYAGEIQDLARLRCLLTALPRDSTEDAPERALPNMEVPGDHDVVQHVELMEQCVALKGAHKTAIRNPVGRDSANIFALENNVSTGRRVHSADWYQNSVVLPAPLGPTSPRTSPFSTGKIKAIDCGKTAEVLAYVMSFKLGHTAFHAPGCTHRGAVRRAPLPSGNDDVVLYPRRPVAVMY
ncbi:MAG: hypothetical protein U5K73_09590 [Halofilum sp. (in: g-proteobacteria)]|nr:hypothetical protein [Halofilum sp. (in: g-proteobacteria)]